MSASPLRVRVPWGKVQDLADELIETGLSEDETLDEIAAFLDSALSFGPGPVGAVAEIADRPVIRAALDLVVAMAADPERRAERKARREERRAERRARREARRAR